MPEPKDVLAQLLSPQQADALAAGGTAIWEAAAEALATIAGGEPALRDVDGRLVMPDEIAGDFGDPHLVAPIALSTKHDQSAVAYIVANTEKSAIFFDSQADEPADQEQQTMVMASAILGQLLQAVNVKVFGDSPTGLVLSLDDMLANAMPEVLATLDEPGLLLTATVQTQRVLPVTFFLPGTFLDVVAGSLNEAPAAAEPPPGGADRGLDLPFSLTAEELNAAKIVDEPPAESGPPRERARKREPARSRTAEPEPVPMAELEPEDDEPEPHPVGSGRRPSESDRLREPTPIREAAVRRATFAPFADGIAGEHHSPIDLLAGLEMNVSVELGRTELTVAEVLDLGPGSVIELNRLAGEPVDILVNDRVIARGEVVVVDENFGVRVVEVVRRNSRNGKNDE